MKDFIDMIRSKDSSGLVQHLDALRLCGFHPPNHAPFIRVDLTRLKRYCGHRDKERVAVRKIFEDKIKGVVDNVVKGLIGSQVLLPSPRIAHPLPISHPSPSTPL